MEEFDRILALLRSVDPLDLIAGGAPDDEYELEALEMLLMKKKGFFEGDAAITNLIDVFRKNFGEDVDVDDHRMREIVETMSA